MFSAALSWFEEAAFSTCEFLNSQFSDLGWVLIRIVFRTFSHNSTTRYDDDDMPLDIG